MAHLYWSADNLIEKYDTADMAGGPLWQQTSNGAEDWVVTTGGRVLYTGSRGGTWEGPKEINPDTGAIILESSTDPNFSGQFSPNIHIDEANDKMYVSTRGNINNICARYVLSTFVYDFKWNHTGFKGGASIGGDATHIFVAIQNPSSAQYMVARYTKGETSEANTEATELNFTDTEVPSGGGNAWAIYVHPTRDIVVVSGNYVGAIDASNYNLTAYQKDGTLIWREQHGGVGDRAVVGNAFSLDSSDDTKLYYATQVISGSDPALLAVDITDGTLLDSTTVGTGADLWTTHELGGDLAVAGPTHGFPGISPTTGKIHVLTAADLDTTDANNAITPSPTQARSAYLVSAGGGGGGGGVFPPVSTPASYGVAYPCPEYPPLPKYEAK